MLELERFAIVLLDIYLIDYYVNEYSRLTRSSWWFWTPSRMNLPCLFRQAENSFKIDG